MSHISVKNLFIYYNDYCALEDIHFEVSEGEFVAIVGRSGSGKTTLLNAIAGLISYAGKIIVPGTIGMVFQNYAVFPWMNVSKNITFGLENMSNEKKAQILHEHLALTELEGEKHKYPLELSGGQVQRVALARALAPSPDVLLMDEPYGALDAYTRDKMQLWLLDIWTRHKKTVVFVTHNIEEAIFLADRVLVLKNKKFIEEYIVPFKRPRQEEIRFSPEFNKLKKKIHGSLN